PAEASRSIWRSRSTPGGGGYNEIMMEDRAGAEVLELHAQRDLISSAGRNASHQVAVNHSVEVGGDQSTHVTGNAGTACVGNYTLSATEVKISSSGDTILSAGDELHEYSDNQHLHNGSTYIDSKDVVQVNADYFDVFARS